MGKGQLEAINPDYVFFASLPQVGQNSLSP
jgi:hypothetical protein